MDDLEKSTHDLWERRAGVDLWSVPHLLFGVLMGFSPSLIGTSFVFTFSATVILASLWEALEKVINIKESKKNIVLDIVLSVIGFLATAPLLAYYSLERDDLWAALALVGAIYVFMIFSGWRAHRRRERKSPY